MILERETKEEKEELPDYEKNRMKNIQEQKAMFLEQLKKSAKALSNSVKPKPKPFPIYYVFSSETPKFAKIIITTEAFFIPIWSIHIQKAKTFKLAFDNICF